jgi:hypothetical protein
MAILQKDLFRNQTLVSMAILLRGLVLIGDVKQPILLVTDLGLEEETVTRLTRVGFDVIGHLKWLSSLGSRRI